MLNLSQKNEHTIRGVVVIDFKLGAEEMQIFWVEHLLQVWFTRIFDKKDNNRHMFAKTVNLKSLLVTFGTLLDYIVS